MKKQKLYIILALFLFIITLNQSNSIIVFSYENKIINYGNLEKQSIIKNKISNSKKELVLVKKEIQKRKKLHKSLLEKYNITFENSILNDITSNSLQIDMLLKIKNNLVKNKKNYT